MALSQGSAWQAWLVQHNQVTKRALERTRLMTDKVRALLYLRNSKMITIVLFGLATALVLVFVLKI